MKNKKFELAAIVTIAILVSVVFFFKIQYDITYRLVKEEARRVLPKAKKIKSVTPKKDLWGNKLIYTAHLSEDFIVVSVRSIGRDEMPNTKDDIKYDAKDFNKSRLIGKFIGTKSKEFADGLIDGVKSVETFKGRKTDNE